MPAVRRPEQGRPAKIVPRVHVHTLRDHAVYLFDLTPLSRIVEPALLNIALSRMRPGHVEQY
jgi:hypothetical protein